jgi:hypothetical protein
MSAGLPLENETELLAWALLRAANRTQGRDTTVRLVVPRAPEVAHDLGIEQISQERIVEAEEWLEERGYLAPVNIGLTWGTYTITSAGLEWLRGGMPKPLEAPQKKATEHMPSSGSASGAVDAAVASERVSWWRRLFGGTG